MPYTRVTRTANGAAAISYAISGSGHNGADARNEMVTVVRMHNQSFYHIQMDKYWKRARSNHKTQIIRIVQSFSKNEFDPNDPADILKANEVGQAMIDEHYPHRQALVCTQTDGKGGCVHNHILINDVSMNNNKGCAKEQYYQPILKIWTDEITARYTNLDYGNEHHDKLTQAERAKREKGEYCYKDDLKQRVSSALKHSISEEDFLRRLNENGVNVTRKNSPKYGKHYIYELVDTSAIPEDAKLPNHKLHIRSYKLGTDYGPWALKQHLEALENYILKSEAKGDDTEPQPEISHKKHVPPDTKTAEKTERSEEPVASYFPPIIVPPEPVETHEDLCQAFMELCEENTEEKKPVKSNTPEKKKPRTRRRVRSKTKQKEKPFQIDRGRFERNISGHISDKSASKNIDDREID